ncbi:MAG: flagellar type III secretion system pore protein FliP [Melioribacteraceae bacterium]|nr:flagellar type III secretion system pore protein FliP [Melioribacteraceae bacterium]
MKRLIPILLLCLVLLSSYSDVQAQQSQSVPLPNIGVNLGTSDNPDDIALTLQLLLLLTVLSLAPSILIMTTSYLRIIIVFHFLKSALGTQQMPPNQLLAGVALFITFFIMSPTWNEFNNKALQPYLDKEINIEEAYEKGIEPIREFMLKNTRDEELKFFLQLANEERPNTHADLPMQILVPSFVLSELRAGFIIGFFLFIPFVMVDMIIASILMSMGMMMLPPMMISMPFKILLFVLVDGWSLVVGSVVRSII